MFARPDECGYIGEVPVGICKAGRIPFVSVRDADEPTGIDVPGALRDAGPLLVPDRRP